MATHDQARKGFDKRHRKLLLEREKTIHALTKERDELSVRLHVSEARCSAYRGMQTRYADEFKEIKERADVDDWMIAVYDDECRELRKVVGLLTEGFGVCDVCEHHIWFTERCESITCEECEKVCPCGKCEAGEHVKLMEEYKR